MFDNEANSNTTVPPAPSPDEIQRAMARAHVLRSEAFADALRRASGWLATLRLALAGRVRGWHVSPRLPRERDAS